MAHVKPIKSLLIILAVAVATGFSGVLIGFHNSSSAQQPAVEQATQETNITQKPVESMRDLSNVFVDIVKQVKPSVVTVFSERVMRMRNPFYGSPFGGLFGDFFGQGQQQQQAPEQEFRERGLGSGVIVSSEGYILTNNHVVADADTVYVRTADGEQYSAKIIGTDPKTDLAVVQIDAKGLVPIVQGNSDNLQVGEWVLAIGSPLSPDLAQTVTQGIVSATGRSNLQLAEYEDFIQTDAAINPGNSGGPLVNLDGKLIGINTAIMSRSGGFQGIGFAIPINMAKNVMKSLISTGHVVRGWLGVSIQDINDAMAKALNLESTNGTIVGEVVEDSPAQKAGLKEGDVIVDLNGKTMTNSTDLKNAVASLPPGSKVTLTIVRDHKQMDLPVTLGEQPGEMAAMPGGSKMQDLLGFSVSQLTPALADQYGIDRSIKGVVVTSVDQAGMAYREGVREGDVIVSANRRRVTSVQDFTEALGNLKKGDAVLLRIYRQGNTFFLAYRL